MLTDDRDIELVLVKDPDGHLVLPAFTSVASLARWRPGASYIELEGRSFLGLLCAQNDWDRIVVDPDSRRAFEINRADAVELLGDS